MQSGSRRCLTTATKQSTLLTPASVARGNATKAAAAVNVKESNVKREHPLFDVRRLKARSGWKPKPPRNADEEIFPDERLGNIIDLNWSLTPYGVVPNNDLFRNLHLRGLQMLTKSKIDSQKAVHVTLNSQEETWQQFYVPPPQPAPAQAPPAPQGAAPGQPAAAPAPAPPSPPQLFAPQVNAKPINPNSYKLLYKEVRKFLSASPNIFMHDGAVGTHRFFEELSRFIVSDADTALLLKHIIPPIPLQNPKEHRESVTSFVASGLQLRNPEEAGLQGNSFTVVDFAQHRILVGGTRSAEALQQAVASLVTYQLAHKGVLPLSASSILGADGKPILVFGSSLNFSRNDLFGSSGQLWSPVGVSRLFNGAVTPYNNEPLSRGDMVWTASGKSSVVAPLSKSAHPCAGHPAKVVFVTEGTKTELNKLTSDKAAERYTTSFNFPVYISHAILKERFEQALKEHKVSVFELSVNSKSKDKEAEAKALLLKN